MKRLALLVFAAGCGVTPITNRLKVGEEPIVVVVGEGADGNTDLFAAPAGGGPFHQLTFTRVAEDLPRLSPAGTKLAFVRRTERPELVVFDLVLGMEQTAPLPGEPVRLGWTAGSDTVVAATAGGVFAAALGGRTMALAPAAAGADSLTAERLGSPAFATVGACRAGAGLCVVTVDSQETALGTDASDGIRWGPRAVAYIRAGRIEVRPLGGGRIRQPTWTALPANLRRPTHHPGEQPE